MIADEVPLVVVSRQLGHSKASTTANIYAHVIKSTQAKAMETFDRFNDLLVKNQPESPALELSAEKIKKVAGD